MLGQLPVEHTTLDSIFERVGVDYAWPFYVKYGFICKPTIAKAYAYAFVSP